MPRVEKPRVRGSEFMLLAKSGAADCVEFPITPSISKSLKLSLSAWASLDARGRMIVTRSGDLVAISESARNLLGESGALAVGENCLKPKSSARANMLSRLLQVKPDEVCTCLIDRAQEQGHVVCRSVALPSTGEAELVAVEIVAADPDAKADWVDFRVSHGMTDIENQVLVSLLDGLCPQEIANRMSVSVNTVRTHVRHIYEKLAVNSIQELHRKLSAYRLR